jgi:hypothetical protein
MFESLSHRKQDLYNEPSPLNNLTPYSRLSRQPPSALTPSLDSTLIEHGLERVQPDLTSQTVLHALALALSVEESDLLGRVRAELSEMGNSGRLPLRLSELRSRKDLFVKIMDNPGLEEFHKVVPNLTQYLFDICSFAFKVKIIVCSVAHNSRALIETIYANKFRDEIRILKVSHSRYEGLQKRTIGVENGIRGTYNSIVDS